LNKNDFINIINNKQIKKMNNIFNVLNGPISIIYRFISLSDIYDNNWNTINKLSNKCITESINLRTDIFSELNKHGRYSVSFYNNIRNLKTFKFEYLIKNAKNLDIIFRIVKDNQPLQHKYKIRILRICINEYDINLCEHIIKYIGLNVNNNDQINVYSHGIQRLGKQFYILLTKHIPNYIFTVNDFIECIQFGDCNISANVAKTMNIITSSKLLEICLHNLSKVSDCQVVSILLSKYPDLFETIDLACVMPEKRIKIFHLICNSICHMDLSKNNNNLLFRAMIYNHVEFIVDILLKEKSIIKCLTCDKTYRIIKSFISYQKNKILKLLLMYIANVEDISNLINYAFKYNNNGAADILLKTKKNMPK